MERKLIDYLPYVVREFDVFRAMMAGEQPEFESAWDMLEEVMNNQFILSAGDMGLSRWERLLQITPKGTDTIDDRRFRILTQINEEQPFTLPRLRRLLEILCGADNFTVSIPEGSYQLTVKIGLEAQSNFADVKAMLDRIVPQNIAVDLLQLYNTYAELSRFTHGQMAAYTHHDLRNEVFSDGEQNS